MKVRCKSETQERYKRGIAYQAVSNKSARTQSANHTVSQPVYPPVREPYNKPWQTACQPVREPANKPVSQPANQPASHADNQLAGQASRRGEGQRATLTKSCPWVRPRDDPLHSH